MVVTVRKKGGEELWKYMEIGDDLAFQRLGIMNLAYSVMMHPTMRGAADISVSFEFQ